MRDKTGIALGTLIAFLVLVTMSFYLGGAESIEAGEMSVAAVALTLVAFAMYVLWDRVKNVKKGLPAKDERLEIISYKAGHYGFIAAIWTAVGAPVLSGILFGHELEGHHVTAFVVIVSSFVFAISYIYLARKGN